MRLARPRWSMFVLAALLQACGGGGGGGGGGDSGGSNPPPASGTLVSISGSNALVTGILTFGPAESALQAMQLLSAATGFLHLQDLVPLEFDCVSVGSVRLSAQDLDFNGVLSAGDRVTVTYTDCAQSTRGTLELRLSQVAFTSDSISSLSGQLTIDLEIIHLATAQLNGSGALAYSSTANELRWLGTGFTVESSSTGQTERLTSGRIEKSIAAASLAYSLTLSGTIDSDALAGRFTFATNEAFSGVEGEWPVSGRATATGMSNSKASFTPAAGAGMMAYQVDADGNGQFEFNAAPVPWTEVVAGLLFGVFDDPGGPGDPGDPGDPPPPPPPDPPTIDVLGRRVALGAPGEDLQVDTTRARIYVTLPDRNELVVLSAQTLAIEQRILVGPSPKAMSISLDGEELFIALSAAGSIATVDLDTLAVAHTFVATTVGSSQVHDVAEALPGLLFAAPGTDRESGWVARIDRSTGQQSRAPFLPLHARTELLPDPARGVIYVGTDFQSSPQSLYKLDTTDPLAPLLLEDDHGSIGGTERMSLSPDGTRLYLRSGQVIDTADFSELGELEFGVPWAMDNGMDVMVGTGTGTLHIYSAADLQEVDVLTTDCELETFDIRLARDVHRISPSPVDGQWLMLGGSVLCAIDLNNPRVPPGSGQPGVPANPPPTLNVPVIDLPLGAEAFDAEFDFNRNRIYVSLPTTGEIVTVDAAAHQVSHRDPLGNAPRGLDLSPDASTLAVMFNGNGHIGFKNLASGQTETRDLTPFLGSSQGHDVAYVNDDAIFASADQPLGEAHLVKASRLDPAATLRVTGGAFLRDRPELGASPDGLFLYGTERDQDVHKFDLSQPDAPLVLESGPGLEFGADRFNVSPDGERIALRGGHVVRTNDFSQAGEISTGIPLFTQDGAQAYVASAPGRIDRFDVTDYVPTETIFGNCSIGMPRRLLSNNAGNVMVTVGQSRLCFWFLEQQITSNVRIGTHSAYVCGRECLERKYRQRSGVRFGEWRPNRQPAAD